MIGVFDSGLGGLTALRELRALLPSADLVYFGDTGRVPYGTRSAEAVTRYARQDMRFLQSHGVDIILAACGTVSSVALPLSAGECDIPVVGVISAAARAAADATRNGTVAVIGTGTTIASGAFERELRKCNDRIKTFSRACPLFVPLVENGYIGRDNEVCRLVARDYLADIRESGADTLILGCTHFPIIADVISDALPGVTLINSGLEAAREISRTADGDGHGTTKIFVSDNPQNFEAIATIFLGHKPNCDIEKIDIESY